MPTLAATAVLRPVQPTMAATTSAAGLLSLLDEDEDSLKLYALQQLNTSVHDFWFQISTSIAAIEALYEDEEFSHRELAALVASKVRGGGGCGRCAAPAKHVIVGHPTILTSVVGLRPETVLHPSNQVQSTAATTLQARALRLAAGRQAAACLAGCIG